MNTAMIRTVLIAGLCLVTLIACKNGTIQQEVPAVISEATAASRAELQALVSKALAGANVILAEDALSQSSMLIVDRQVRRDAQGNRLLGRDLGKPERFQLLLRGDKCALLQQSTGKRWELQEATCVPEQRARAE